MSEAMPSIIEDLRRLLYSQSEADVLALEWDRVAELRVAPEDFNAIVDQIPAREPGSPPSRYSVRIVVDRYLKPGKCVPLDAHGNVLSMPRATPRHGEDHAASSGGSSSIAGRPSGTRG